MLFAAIKPSHTNCMFTACCMLVPMHVATKSFADVDSKKYSA